MAVSILIVDDSVIMLNLIRQALLPDGYLIVSGRDGKEGLECFSDNPEIDIVITDINMPVMGGLELIQEIRKIDGRIPIFALTSESDTEMRERGRQAGANGWIVKPFQPPQFRDVIRQVIDRFGIVG